jgi:hypothetical protein
MKIAYFPNQTALKSETIWRSFLDGLLSLGFTPVEGSMTADCAVIWSVLWNGRMRNNKPIYDHYRKQNKPVFIIEVGSLARGTTWKISANHIDSSGIYGNKHEQDIDRPKKLGIYLKNNYALQASSYLIALQQPLSLQWQGQPSLDIWLYHKIQEIRQISNDPIIIRPHPRHHIRLTPVDNVFIETPKKIFNTYDQYDLTFNHRTVINHNSGSVIQAVIEGIPVNCHYTSLAYPVSSPISSPVVMDRNQWLVDICHTEWTEAEIACGIPQNRILKVLTL